ncbi:MAG: GNAT family N-acetyltransferase [Enterobacterales bacterium]|nr:GNAT family N-acetyltransferase [Enterobacterales bacterium]
MTTDNSDQFRQLQFIQQLPIDAKRIGQSYPNIQANIESAKGCLLLSNLASDKNVTTNFPDNLARQKIAKATQFLGQELKLIIFDARESFDVNSFCAICGCLVAKGTILVILPQHFNLNKKIVDDNAYRGLACLNRLQRYSTIIKPELETSLTEHKRLEDTATVKAFPQQIPSNQALQQQQQVISQIKRCATGHARRPLILSAHRGRGKSAALGIACAELVYEKNKAITICSTRKSNLKVFYTHYFERLQNLSGDTIDLNQSLAENFIEFIPPDQLAELEPSHQLFIVEEAGSIPVQLLKKIASKSNRLIFSTTLDGYEGNGQGFELRFIPFLSKLFRQINRAELTIPMRWSANDPLEKAINNAFLLANTSQDRQQKRIEQSIPSIHCKAISQQQLNDDEELLKTIFRLLVTAHYQTRPSDLESLLSDPNWLVFASFAGQQLIAACVLSDEGQLDQELCAAIEKGSKRLKGHLLPQSLMAYQGIELAGCLHYWRIIRIAVLAQFRRQNVASELIDKVKQQAKQASVDILGASYAMFQDVLSFWYHCEFQCTRIALKKESSTGSHPAEFLWLCQAQNKEHFKQSLNQFNQSFLHALATNYRSFDPQHLQIIIDQQIAPTFHNACTMEFSALSSKSLRQQSNDRQHYNLKEVKRYIEQARSFEMVEWHLYHFVIDYWILKNSTQNLTPWEKQILMYKLFQNKNWHSVAKRFNQQLSDTACNPSKKLAQQGLRKIIAKLLDH